ncbi:hypothetical protein AX15_003618 [Amanita polypyramis BW_CC]|nr:hypothetical protein AX15_003618 [Amanita polypyramis BW_CC]
MSTTTEETQPSPAPFSPFSDSTTVSEPTSDEHPDLGQFNFVFRTLTHLQPHPWIPAFNGIYPSSTDGSSTARGRDFNEGAIGTETRMRELVPGLPEGSTVWQQQPILSYLDFSSSHTQTPSELIVDRFVPYGPLEERDQLQRLQATYEQQRAEDSESRRARTVSPGHSLDSAREHTDEDGDDTEAGMTVEISSNDSEELDLSIGDGSPDSHSEEEEEINPDGEYEAEGEEDAAYGGEGCIESRSNGQIPRMWQSLTRVPLRAYSPIWDSEENPDEFGPFDGATTASSGTRATEPSDYHPVYRHPTPLYREAAGTPSSVQDGTGSVTSRTSPPTDSLRSITSSTSSLPSFPVARDSDDGSYSGFSDIRSQPERPASVPVVLRGGSYVFSYPLNDNSTPSSFSSASSPPPVSLAYSDYHNMHQQCQSTAQPQRRLIIPLPSHRRHHHQHRRWNSGSNSTSTITSTSATAIVTHAANGHGPDLAIFPLSPVVSRTSPPRAVQAFPCDSGGQHNVELQSSDNNSNSSHGDSASDITTPSGTSLDSVQLVPSPAEAYESFMDPYNIPSYANGSSEDGVEGGLDDPLPSLGLLDEALKFIGEERARWEALRDAGTVSGSLSSDSERWKCELESDSARESHAIKSTVSDLMLLSPELQTTPRKKKKIKKVTRSGAGRSPAKKASAKYRLSGTATPIVSILRPDGTITARNPDASRKRRSLDSDGHLGSGTLTPRVGGAGQIEADDLVGMDSTPKKGKDNNLPHLRSVPQLKIVTGTIQEGPAKEVLDSRTCAAGPVVRVKGKYANVNHDNITNAQTHAVNTKRTRLLGLAKQLQELFLEDRSRLDHVLNSLEHQRVSKSQRKKGKRKASQSSGEDRVVLEDEDEDLDPRGRPPRNGDPLIHVFIDHSNILFGLLTHLKRHPPRRPLPPTPSATKPVCSAPASPSGTDGTESTSIPSASTILALPSFATARVRTPSEGEHETGGELIYRVKTTRTKRRVRHLSHTGLALILERGRPVTRRVLVTSSPLYQPMDGMERLGYQVSVFLRVPDLSGDTDRDRDRQKDRHRETINPTLGRSNTHSDVHKCVPSGFGSGSGSGSGSSSGIMVPRKKSHTKHLSSSFAGDFRNSGRLRSKDADDGIPAPSSFLPPSKGVYLNAMHSQNTAAVGGANNNLCAATGTGASTGTPGTGTPHRIRFREQGVDELLQLKLHQALAAEDEVPEGATIVLATGDGNVGQFNEEGFIGPVRTALKRGWKVELYSWEGGLSRAWKREFGEESEWGQSGMFRVIGMEQFASSLVEDGWVAV